MLMWSKRQHNKQMQQVSIEKYKNIYDWVSYKDDPIGNCSNKCDLTNQHRD